MSQISIENAYIFRITHIENMPLALLVMICGRTGESVAFCGRLGYP